jgi:hypothetical protein
MINHRGPYDACSGIQVVLTAILGQVYATLSSVSTSAFCLRNEC